MSNDVNKGLKAKSDISGVFSRRSNSPWTRYRKSLVENRLLLQQKPREQHEDSTWTAQHQ